MLKRGSQAPARVLNFPVTPRQLQGTEPGDSGLPSSLEQTVSRLKKEAEGLTMRMIREHGQTSDAALRAEQVAHAVQRLEWALEREIPPPEAS